jgi:putative lipoic acid-binding regulatory protein
VSDQPKKIDDADAGSTQTLLTFPTMFPIKAMGRREDGFAQAVLEIVLKHAPDFDAGTIEMRPSKNGNFLSVTATINARSKAQLDDIYRGLTSHPLVLMAL